MKRRRFVGFGSALSALAVAPHLSIAGQPQGIEQQQWAQYDDSIVIDALASPIQFNIPQSQLPLSSEELHLIDLSGITAVNITVNAWGRGGVTDYEATKAKMDAWSQQIEASPKKLSQVRTVSDIQKAKQGNQLGLIFGFQDGTPFEDNLDRIAEFQQAGVRVVQLTYNKQNKLGSGCLVAKDTGLTELGYESIELIEHQQMLLDLSHCGPQTTLQGIKAATRPTSITHTGCKSVFDHPRNKDDETLRELAETGGVVGIYLMPFLNRAGAPQLEHVIEHLIYALNLCGEDHVGIGSDQGIVPLNVEGNFQQRFNEVAAQRKAAGIAAPREDTIPYVPDLNHPRRMETICSALVARGYSSRVVEKVIGANFLRLFSEVWS